MTTIYDFNGVTAWEYHPDPGQPWSCYMGVSDERFMHYRITFSASEHGDVSVSVDAEWNDKHPGQLANFTHEISPRCTAEDTLSISDDGLLSALARTQSAAAVNLRRGILLQLPVEYVQPVRLAIAKARQLAVLLADAAAKDMPLAIPTILSADEHIAYDWWLGIHCSQEKKSWMARAGNTGLVLDAYRECQRMTAGLPTPFGKAPFGWDMVEA